MESILNKIKEYLPENVDLDVVLKFIKDHKAVVAVTSVAVLYGVWFFKRPRNLPPGPYGYPIIGSLPTMTGEINDNLKALGDKYGDVFTLWFGRNNYTVVLSSYDTITEVALKRGTEFLERKETIMMKTLNIEDTMSTSSYHDPLYQMSRKTAVQGIRTIITTKIDEYINQEILKLMKTVAENGKGTPIEINTPVHKFGANIALGVFFNKTYDTDDPEFISFMENVHKWYDLLMAMMALDLFGSGMALLMRSKIKAARKATSTLEEFISEHIAESKSSLSEGQKLRSLVDAYLLSEEKKNFPAKKMAGTILLLIPDSVRTVANMCIWQIVYLLHNPQYQDQILEEVSNVVGTTPLSVSNRPSMPLTEAFTMEVFRHVCPAAFGGASVPFQETTLRGYRIPKDVAVISYYGGVMKDPKYFPEPKKFKPERFIQNGKVSKADGFWPFGLGKRSCIGENLARNVIFMFLGSLIQKYNITQGPEGLPSLKKDPKAVEMVPEKFKIILEERK